MTSRLHQRYADEIAAVDGQWRFRQREYTPWISPSRNAPAIPGR